MEKERPVDPAGQRIGERPEFVCVVHHATAEFSFRPHTDQQSIEVVAMNDVRLVRHAAEMFPEQRSRGRKSASHRLKDEFDPVVNRLTGADPNSTPFAQP